MNTATREMRRTRTTMQGLLVYDVLRFTAGLTFKIVAAQMRAEAAAINALGNAAIEPAFYTPHTEGSER